MFKDLKRILIGKPLKNEALGEERFNVLWGLPILSSDAISSVAYATEEILAVLIPAIGILAYGRLSAIAIAIIALLALLTLSYRQTIENYPNGGGAYVVAKENLGVIPGVTAGAALSVDYILTVAVSISSGTAAITSAIPALYPHRVAICLLFLALLLWGNLRGISESAKIFSLPAYAFILAILSMIVGGIVKWKVYGYVPPTPPAAALAAAEPVTLILLLRAFSSGCTALTGVEAVSNAVPNFREPSVKNAQKVLVLLSFLVFILFGGTTILANIYHVVPVEHKTVLSQIAQEIFGNGFMFYYIQAATAIILAMAANTAYSGFPLLVSVMAQEGYAPRQLSMRGERLSYSNGIAVLTAIAAVLIVVFQGDTHKLIPLYAVGVFISFTLSQSGMFVRWLRHREKHWMTKAAINGLGALVSGIVVAVIGILKFKHGAWVVIIVIPILIFIMLRVKRHYTAVATQLRVENEDLKKMNIDENTYRNRVIVPISSLNKASIRALRFAKTISPDVVAFTIAIDKESGDKVRERWNLLDTEIPLIIKYSPFRKIIDPMLKFIQSVEYGYEKGDMITVILPQFSVKAWWQIFLHNQTRLFLENALLKHEHIVVATMPLKLKSDDEVLGKRR